MITRLDLESATLLYDDSIDLSVRVSKPFRATTPGGAFFRDYRATVELPAARNSFTGPESVRLALLIARASKIANDWNVEFDRVHLN